MATTKITTPELFDFSATNTALQLPTGDTASRPSAPSTGQWRFNTTEKYVEFWDGGAWRQIDTEALPLPADFNEQNFNVNTYFGTGATQTIDAKFNEAANFNGSSSFIETGLTLPADSTMSFAFWFKKTATQVTSGDVYLISDLDSTTNHRRLDIRYNTSSNVIFIDIGNGACLLYTSPSPRDRQKSRMPSSA